jgi:CheY-like chemotaxis protein
VLKSAGLATRKGVHLKMLAVPAELAAVELWGDATWLRQCLNNGLSNALKFTPAGGTVTARACGKLLRRGRCWKVCMSVHDTGMGLSAAELLVLQSGKLFEQVGRGQLQGNGGTGLGLAISREILHLHSGELTLRSDGPGLGATYQITVNMRTARAGRRLTAEATTPPPPLPIPSMLDCCDEGDEGDDEDCGSGHSSTSLTAAAALEVEACPHAADELELLEVCESHKSISFVSQAEAPLLAAERAAADGGGTSSRSPYLAPVSASGSSSAASITRTSLFLPLVSSASHALNFVLGKAAEEPFCALHVEVRRAPFSLAHRSCLAAALSRSPVVSFAPPLEHLTRASCPPRLLSPPRQDDVFLRLTLPQTTFVKVGVEYEQAEDGVRALEMARHKRYDLILMDNQMPNMNGTDATLELRRMGYAGTIVGMTGDPSGCAERERFERSGLDLCVNKDSVGVAEIVTLLQHLLSERDRHVDTGSAAPAPAANDDVDSGAVSAAQPGGCADAH